MGTVTDSTPVLCRALTEARATPYTVTVTLTREDWENFAAVRDAWNADRVRRGLPRLDTAATISRMLRAAAGWLAGKDTP